MVRTVHKRVLAGQVRSGRAQVCEVVFVKTGEKCDEHLLHHECKDEGYDQAVCPTRKEP